MRILYIIGNGLDIAHHLKTSYHDFLEYYLAINSDDIIISSMKRDIKQGRYSTWSDLEMGLGKYSSKCNSKSAFLKCLNDIKTSLKEYLKKESEKIMDYHITSLSHIKSPESCLEPEPLLRYNKYINVNEYRLSGVASISIITLNYTKTLEEILHFQNPTSFFPQLRTIQHIHGTLDDMMVMGVNDSTQISNKRFNTDLDVLEEFVKPEFNEACLNNKNAICESLINDADVIVLYGTSLGPSDDKWWKLIGQRLSSANNPLLIYLPYDDNKNVAEEPNHLRRWTKEYVQLIHDRFDIGIDVESLASRICIGINKTLLPIAKTKHSQSVIEGK